MAAMIQSIKCTTFIQGCVLITNPTVRNNLMSSEWKLLSADELDAMNAICAMFAQDCGSANPPGRSTMSDDIDLFTPEELAKRWNGSGQNRRWEEITEPDRLNWAQQQAILADRDDYKRLRPLLYAAGDGHQISLEESLGQPIWVARRTPGCVPVGVISHHSARACYDALTERQLLVWQRVNTKPAREAL
jgi:hypothetical protein